MSGTTISALPAASSVGSTNILPIVALGSPNVTQRATFAQVFAGLAGQTIPGTLATQGVTNGSVAAAGYVGELLGGVYGPLTASLTNTNFSSITLTAGQWLTFGSATYLQSGGAFSFNAQASISLTSLTIDPNYNLYNTAGTNLSYVSAGPVLRPVNVSTSTVAYFVGNASFSGTCTAQGYFYALRVR